SVGPVVDEGGWGYSVNLVQAKSVRDVAAMLDCVSTPQVGDPFIIPRPEEPYASLSQKAPGKLKVGIVLDELAGVSIDPEVAAAVEATGRVLSDMGHTVERAKVDMGGAAVLSATTDLFFLGSGVPTCLLRPAPRPRAGPPHLGPRDLPRAPRRQGPPAGALHRRHQRRQCGPPQAGGVLQ